MILKNATTESQGKRAGVHIRSNEISRKRKMVFCFFLFLLAFILIFCTGFFVYMHFSKHTVTFVTAEGSTSKVVFSQSPVSFPSVTAPEQLNFIGWKDSKGNIELQDSIYVTEDEIYTAQYISALNTQKHTPYLFADGNGLYRPYAVFTRGEAAIAVYSLLCGKIRTDEGFADITDDMECSSAAAQLKALGIVEGSQFHPDDGILWIDLIHILTSFYQPTSKTYDFRFISSQDYGYDDCCTAASLGWLDKDADFDPYGTMSRLEAAQFLNRILGRSADASLTLKETGVLSDAGPFSSSYLQFAEACVNHDYEFSPDGAEHWISCDAPKKLYSGYVFINGKLRFADDSGLFIIGTNSDGLYFQQDGSYTSGSELLDSYVWEILDQISDESLSREQMLHKAYDLLVTEYTEKKGNTYEKGSTDWITDEAISFFKNGEGSSYSFAAGFCALARGLGYPAKAEAGLMYEIPHGWVTIPEEDTWYIYDPEQEISSKTSCWKMDRFAYYSLFYSPDPQISYGQENAGDSE